VLLVAPRAPSARLDGILIPAFLARTGSALKQLTRMVFSRGRTWAVSWLAGTTVHYEREINPYTNAIVMSVVNWVARTFPEAPLRVLRRSDEHMEPVADHPMIALLRRPNPYYSGIVLWMATIASWMITGNAYWLKIRASAGNVVELWWVPPSMMEPAWPPDGTQFISHYDYRPDGRAIPIRVNIADVVHLRYGIDPDNPRKGLSPLAAVVREIYTDDEGANFSASLLRHVGVPGVIITPDDEGNPIQREEADQMKQEFATKFTADRRGEPMILSNKTKVQVLSFSPEQMSLRDMRQVPEERITAVFGVPAIVVGLGAGLARSTFANFAESREAAYEGCIIPTQRLFSEDLRVQLLADFADIKQHDIDFDLSKVRVLQEDQNKMVDRLTRSLLAGGLQLNSYLRQIGEEELGPGGEIFYVPSNVLPTPASEIAMLTRPVDTAPEGPVPTNGTTNGVVAA